MREKLSRTVENIIRLRLYRETNDYRFLYKNCNLEHIMTVMSGYWTDIRLLNDGLFSEIVKNFLIDNKLLNLVVDNINHKRSLSLTYSFDSLLELCESNNVFITRIMSYFFDWRSSPQRFSFWEEKNREMNNMIYGFLSKQIYNKES